MTVTRKKHKRVDWFGVREDFIHQSIMRKPGDKGYTLREHATFHCIDYGGLRNRAGEEDWRGMVSERRAERQRVVSARIEDVRVMNEVETRCRQAEYAQVAQRKAAERITKIDPTKLTVDQAISLMRLGLTEERKAMGLPDVFHFEPPPAEGGELKLVKPEDVKAFLTKLAADVNKKLLEHDDSGTEKTIEGETVK